MLRKIRSALSGQIAGLAVPGAPFDLDDPAGLAAAQRQVRWSDHGILRTFWTNFHHIAPDVARSNHPGHARLTSYADAGFRAVLNLRGSGLYPAFALERQSCAALGLMLHDIRLRARRAPDRDALLLLFDTFDTIQRPFVMHCKSGADRAGLASALYLLDQGASIADARAQLSVRYLHLRFTRAGIQGLFLDTYANRLTQGPITVRDWVRDEYDAAVLTERFAARRGSAMRRMRP